MDPLTEELLEELDAYRPAWRREFKCVGAAAQAAGVLGLYIRWTQTAQGRQYLAQYGLTPDYEAVAKTLVELDNEPDPSLPFSLKNFAWLAPDESWPIKVFKPKGLPEWGRVKKRWWELREKRS